MDLTLVRLMLAAVLIGGAAADAFAQSGGAPVTLKSVDGTHLKATYFAAGKPGPGILLLHQCNRDRRSWTSFAEAAAKRGFHVLTLDYRGYGESGGSRASEPQEQQAIIDTKWPADVDAALAYLISQPGVNGARIGAAGASCGVNQSAQLARRHASVKTVILLSGNVNPAAREHIQKSPDMPVLAVASQDDGTAVETMRWIVGWSRNPGSKFVEYKAAGHGTDMFAVEAGLQPLMLDWFDRHLVKASATTPAPAVATATTPVEEFWTLLTKPDGIAKARQLFDATRQKDRSAVLFPEGEMNLFGYQLLQEGNTKGAIAVFQMNVDAYPTSANTYDSLSDAYLADGNRTEALRLAERALELLPGDTRAPEEFKQAIRESAEKKIKELKR